MRKRLALPLVIAVSLAVGACMTPSLPPSQTQSAPPPAAAGPSAGITMAPSTLSYGTVTAQVVKGKTTQADLLQLFGGPNISTVDGTGLETWVYERSATQSDYQSNNQSAQAAASLGAFFKYVDAKVSGSVERGSAASSYSSSFRALTVIVKFAPDKTVADYSVRASNF